MQTSKWHCAGDGWENTSPDTLHNKHISIWACAHCFWQLCSHSYGWWRAMYSWTFWYCRTRGVWQIMTAEFSTNSCLSSLLFSGLSILLWKCERKTGVWDNSPLSKDPNCSHRWPVYHWETCKNERKPITPEYAEKPAGDLKAVSCGECSALTQRGLENAFRGAILISLEPPEAKSHKFALLWTSLQSPLCKAGTSNVLEAVFKSN